MSDWSNPHADFQHAVRTCLKDRLRRTNGRITYEAFMDCVVYGRAEKADKMRLRLLVAQPDGTLEWKPELVTEDAVRRQVAGSAAIDMTRLTELWSTSRRIENRTEFPFLAPVGNKSQHVSRNDWRHRAVFGVDILIRPPTEFSEDRDEKVLRNDLVLGEECFAVVAHGNMLNGRLADDGEYFARLVIGNAFSIPRIGSLVPLAATRCELSMRKPLLYGDADGVVDAALPHLNRFASDAYAAFIS